MFVGCAEDAGGVVRNYGLGVFLVVVLELSVDGFFEVVAAEVPHEVISCQAHLDSRDGFFRVEQIVLIHMKLL